MARHAVKVIGFVALVGLSTFASVPSSIRLTVSVPPNVTVPLLIQSCRRWQGFC